MVLKALALAATLTLTTIPAALSQDADPEQCTSLAAVHADLTVKKIDYTDYTDGEAKKLIENIVAIFGEPPSDAYLLADPLVVAEHEGMIFVGFVVNGCYIGRAIVPVEIWNTLVLHGRGA